MQMSFRSFKFSIGIALGLSLVAGNVLCGQELSKREAVGKFGAWGVDLTGMDKSIKPGDDFYTYVNGKWHAAAEIPSDKKQTGPTVALLDLAFDQLKVLLEEAAADTTAPKGSDRQKIGDWYASLMDEEKLAALGVKPIQADLDRIQAIEDRTALADLLADNLGGLGAAPLGVSSGFDRRVVDKALPSIATGGLSMPARELYLETDAEAVRKLYSAHLARMFKLAGLDDGEKRAERVLALETRIAEFTWPLAEQRDPRKLFNPMPAKRLPEIAPGIDWSRFLKRAGVGAPETVIVTTESSIAGMSKLIAEAPLEDWRDYCTYRLLLSVENALPKPFRDEWFAFYGKTLGGQPEPDPRWKEVLMDLGWKGSPLGDALGKVFVARYVPAEARPQAKEMVQNLIKAFDARLAKLAWMTEKTRASAREKLAKTTIKLIYPDVWQDTKGLEVVRGDAIGNLRRGYAFLRKRDLDYLKKIPNRGIYFKPVYEVNAYAFPVWNEIAFMAAIVRPPFFDPAADPAVNYGAMGAVIGHEISHLFDDQGRLSDGDGLLRDWWTAEDAKKFEAVADRLSRQMSSYEPLPGKHINGQLTLGESIADVAGLTVAFDAFQLYLNGKQPPVVDGFTANQRFFLAYAQMWRWKPRDAYLDKLLKTDFHPPTHFRPYTVRNIDAWYEAFDVKPGDKLYLSPTERVQPW